MNQFRSTLDIDTNDKLTVSRILNKIAQCEQLNNLTMNFSSMKGVHVTLDCRIECDICRFCYDDWRRFAYDVVRPKEARDILFEGKEWISLKRLFQ